MHRANRSICALYPLVALILPVLFGCPNRLTHAMLNRVKDDTAPAIQILHPADGSPYAATVLVSGIVTDRCSEPDASGQVRSLDFEVLATTIAGTASVAADGAFQFSFKTVSLSGNLVVRLRATDWNGNVTEQSLTLVDTGSEVPSFAAAAGNKQVTLSWDPVPLAESYTLHYTTSGAIPSESYGLHMAEVSSPLAVAGLCNGQTHGFLLQVHAAGGEQYFSLPLQAVPVSPSTLVPQSHSEYGKTVLEWPSTPGSSLFEVQRATSLAGPYAPLARNVNGSRYEDLEVGAEQACFYKVRSALPGSPASAPSWGASCPFPEEWLKKIGSVPGIFVTAVPVVAVEGSRAYVLSRMCMFNCPVSVSAVDLSVPSSPQKLADFRVGVKPLSWGESDHLGSDLAVHGVFVYVAGPEQTELSIIDWTDPENPVRRGICGGFAGVQGLEIVAPAADSPYLIGADGLSGLQVVNVSDPDNPFIDGQYPTNGDAQDVSYDPSRDLLYVADGNAGLTVIDNASGTTSVCATGGRARRVVWSGTYAFVADESAGVVVVDAAVPASLLKVAQVDIPEGAQGLALDGDLLYVAAGAGGLQVVNVADPMHPVRMGADRTAVSATSVAVGDGVTLMTDVDAAGLLKIYSLSELRPRPQLTATLAAGGSGGLASNGRYLYAGNGAGMDIVEIASGTVSGRYTTTAAPYTYKMLVHGDMLFLSIGDTYNWSRLEILDISDPVHPQLRSSLDFTGADLFAEARGDIAFVVGMSGFQVFDVCDPGSPVVLGSLGLSGTPCAAAATGNVVCVAAHTGGLQVVDVTDPGRPRRVGGLSLPGSVRWVAVRDNYAFVGSDEETKWSLHAIDIRDPGDPRDVGYVPLASYPSRISISGSFCYVPEANDRLEVADISDPAHPTILASLALQTGDTSGIVVAGSRVYVNEDHISVIELNP